MTREEYFNDGLDAYNNKDYEKAINCFNEIIDKFSNSIGNAKLSETYYMRGICYAQEYSIDEALEDFNEAEKLGFDKSKIYCGRGIAYAHDGKNEKAVSNFTKAIELNGSYEEAYCRKGIAYFFDLKFDEAIINFNKAIELNKYYDKAYYYRGVIFCQKREYDKAIKDFDKAIELDNKYILAYNDRGLVYYNKNEYGKAIEDFNTAIELDNQFALAYGNRGLVYYKLKKYDKAIEDFNKSVKLDAEFIQVYNDIGLAYFYKCEYDKAFKNFKKITPNDALNYMIKLFLINKKDINNIANLPIKYADSYFTSVIGKNIKINKNKLFKIWCYQYILLDLLSIRNYKNIEEFSHYTSKKIFDILISNDVKNNECLRFTSISKANDPKEGEILKNLLYINTEKNIDTKEQNKDYLVLQTSFIRYTDSLTMFRLYGKEEEKEGTGISLVFNNSFFDINELTTTSPAQSLGNTTKYDYKKENNIKNKNHKEPQLNYIKIYPPIEQKDKLLPLYFMLYYDKDKNELIYNPTNSVYENKRIKLNGLNNINFSYDNNIDDIANNIGIIFNKIFDTIKELKSNEELEIAYKLLINIRYLIKHSSFFEEQELRIIQLVKNDGSNVLFDKDINRLYLNYEIPIFEENYLKKIIIGPKVENSSSVKEVYQHLIMKNKSNKNIDIKISDLPLN